MATKRSSGQYELVLENRQLVFIFFGAVMLCAIFFALGFLVGREQRDLNWRAETAKPEGGEPGDTSAKTSPKKEARTSEASKAKNADQDAINKELTFYKTVEGKSAQKFKVNPKEEPASRGKETATAEKSAPPSSPAPSPGTAMASPGLQAMTVIFQVAALSKSDEAQALVRKLKDKGFPAFLVSPPPDSSKDKLYRVQIGPFSDPTAAEQVKAKLVASGYTPITKK